ncbi:hypothetical protein CAAN1_16S03444 [[Candida] anglica]|uniref:Nitrogen regulatory protein areA GATA-like domain-containing protein n=1 Tax=[Candida] anglica TaxID=148631 RepID=A0ABP0ECT6_9ASCO
METLELRFGYEPKTNSRALNEVLINLWKVTSNPHLELLEGNTTSNSYKRLNYRTWRLLNTNKPELMVEKSFTSILKSDTMLSDGVPAESQYLSKRTSLFSDTSKTTLFSHSSKSLNGSAGSPETTEISDISDISEEEDAVEEDDYYDSSEEEQEQEEVQEEVQEEKEEGKESVVRGEEPLKRSTTSFVRGFSPNNSSSISQFTTHLLQRNHEKNTKVFYIANSPSPPQKSGKSPSDLTPGHPTTSTEDEGRTRSDSLFQGNEERSRKQNGISSRRESCSSTDISENDNDNESEWLSVSSEDEQDTIQTKKQEELVFNKRVVDIPSHNIPITNGKSDIKDKSNSVGSGSYSQPRSLLSGLFLNKMADGDYGKPSLLKRASTSDVMRANNGERPSILFSKRHNSLINIGSNSVGRSGGGNENEMEPIVGISDFNVVKQPSLRSLSVNSNSTVNMIQEEEGGTGSFDNVPETLSSSLNKYSNSINGGSSSLSINNLLSKSSKNISGLFHSSRAGEIPTRRSFMNGLFTKRTADNDDDKSPSLGSDSGSGESKSSPTGVDSGSNKENKTNVNKQQIKQTVLVEGTSPNSAMEILHSIPKKTTTQSPKITKTGPYLSSELSESLKDSIKIDYKLGKIPLPEKIVKNINIEKVYIEDVDADDYHSKGW